MDKRGHLFQPNGEDIFVDPHDFGFVPECATCGKPINLQLARRFMSTPSWWVYWHASCEAPHVRKWDYVTLPGNRSPLGD